ncbi:lipin Ned1 [Rhodotorula sphaerocarpa]
MASWVAKAVQYYKDINPATLTGAIDVIVVERPTESGQVELACSPFHVRFGKLSVLRPVDKKVRIAVNDERIPFYMKVGETGEAFFVFETDSDVPADMQTSPLSGPLSDDGRSDAGEVEPLDLDAPAMSDGEEDEGSRRDTDADEDGDPTPASTSFADASPAATSRSIPSPPFGAHRALPRARSESPTPESKGLSAKPASSRGSRADDHEAEDEGHHILGRHVPSPISNAAAQIAATGAAAIRKPVQEAHDSHLKHRVRGEAGSPGRSSKRGSMSEYGLKGGRADIGQPDGDLRDDLAGISLDDPAANGTEETGDAVIAAAREHNADVSALLGGKDGLGHPVAADGTIDREHDFSLEHQPTGQLRLETDGVARDARTQRLSSAPEDTGALMLDMSGYKVEDEKDEMRAKSKRAEQELEGDVSRMGIDEKAEKEIVAFTQALLQSTDPTTLHSFFDGTDELSRGMSSLAPLDLADTTQTASAVEADGGAEPPRRSARASSPGRPVSILDLQSLHAEAEGVPAPDDGVYQATPMQFSLKSGGTVFVFELSLCGSDGLEHLSKAAAERLFADHQVSFNNFLEQDAIPENPDLVVKFSGRYLTWDNASPVLASLAIYRKSLVVRPEHHKPLPRDESGGDTAKRHRRGWSLWWGRGRSAPPPDVASTSSLPTEETSSVATPPTSVPASPRSLPEDAISPPVAPVADDDFPAEDNTKHYAKTLRLTSDQLKTLGLKKGMNTVSFSVRSSYSGYATCTSRIFLWEADFQVVISDIDGTITKSDALGHVFTMIGRDWTHLGVAKLYTDISRNGYKLMYLTSRAVGQADTTREYLKGIKQNGYQLPEGPVIMSPDRLMTSLHREVIMRKPEVFKMACLRDISRLFGERSPFYAGFGNRITDALSYRSVDIPSSRIFTIDTNGEVKMELLELAGYKSSYIHMTDLVDQMFPPISQTTAPDFSDFNYWRTPLPAIDIDIPELAPPSPALSARSDQSSSRLSLGRLGNLASSLSRRSSRGTLADSAANGTSSKNARNARSGTPTSPLLQATVPEESYDLEHGIVSEGDAEDDDFNFDDVGRSRSSSMPGSMPEESDFERYRAIAAARGEVGRSNAATPADEYKRRVRGEYHGDEEDYDEEEEEEVPADNDDAGPDDFGDQLDFSSVPYL